MFKFSCKDATIWAIRLQDESLPLLARTQLRMHLLICKRCREFTRQLDTLKIGVHVWREQTDK